MAAHNRNQTPRFFLVGNAQKPNVKVSFDRLARWLDGKGLLVGSDLDGKQAAINEAKPDYVVALGGDGTILNVVQAMQHRQVPIIGVNLGKLGYLAGFNENEFESQLDRILTDPDCISRRMLLDVLLVDAGGSTWRGIALNDCVLRVGDPYRTVGLSVSIDDHPVTTIIGDGLIIATPTGSTAHNMACGGPIVQPDVSAIVMTPLCPHSLTHRPIVVAPDVRVKVDVRKTSAGVAVVLDGQVVRPVPGGASLLVHRSAEQVQLVMNPHRHQWDLLVQKLKWGQGFTGPA